MRHLCFLLSLVSFMFAFHLAFFYGDKVPKELVRAYDYVVVNPLSIDEVNEKLVGYISICEQSSLKGIKKSWILGKNKSWNSFILDIRNKNYRDFLLKKVESLKKRGFKTLFFDTLDSYQLVLPKKEWQSYEKSLALFIKEAYYKGVDIILNRGFEVFDYVYPYIKGVVAESLFQGFNGKDYVKVSRKDREWLVKKLNYIKSKKIDVIVVDYVQPKNRKKAKRVAKKIYKLGFIPYVSDGHLETIGISDFEIFRRKILVIYISNRKSKMLIDAHRLLQLPIEYLGYVADLKTPKEAEKLKYTIDKYSGIVVWSENDRARDYDNFYKWLLDRKNNGNKILFIANFGFPKENRFLNNFDLKVVNNENIFDKFKIVKKEVGVEFESEVPPLLPDKFIIPLRNYDALLTIKAKETFSPIAVTKWGGYAIDPYVVDSYLEDVKWIIDPFILLKRTLKLENIPKPDYTTENGKRIFFSHLDGDASMSKVEFNTSKLSCEEMRDSIFKKYKNVPFSVSFIEGEIAPYGLYPYLSKRLLRDAISIYALNNIEPASHTFSHPFFWRKFNKNGLIISDKNYTLPIPNYTPNLYREIVGSCSNLSFLAPKNKPVKMIFWTGDCDPPPLALKIAYEHNILNFNGGDTTITYAHNYLSNIAPAGVKKGDYYQIYTAQQDEYIYTDGFTKNFWGYKKVIETFLLTDKPRRFKPIDVYIHYYIASKRASLNSLKFVLDWVLKQDIIRLWTSEYILKVLDFYNTLLLKKDNSWIIKTNKNLRTIRIKDLGYPDLDKSKGVIGFSEYNGNYYLSLDGSGYYKLVFTKKPPKKFYLYKSNARIVNVYKDYYELKANLVNVEVEFKNFKNCHIKSKNRFKRINDKILFNSSFVRFKVECR